MELGITTIDLYLTGQCNMRCGYCYGEDDSKPHMTIETIDACIEFAQNMGMTTIELCGGEPLLSPHFEYAVKEIKKRGWHIILRTNGLMLDRYIDLVAKSCDWVGISVDGLKDINARMRPVRNNMSAEEQFMRPMSSIRKLKEMNKDIKVLLASVATAQNFKDLIKFKDYIISEDLPIDKWKIYQFVEDKFRSVENASQYHLKRDGFNLLIDHIPTILPNGASVIHQRSDYQGAGGNCLLVHQSGVIKILGKEYGQIGVNTTSEIYNCLINSDVVRHIRYNKGLTYHA